MDLNRETILKNILSISTSTLISNGTCGTDSCLFRRVRNQLNTHPQVGECKSCMPSLKQKLSNSCRPNGLVKMSAS